MVIAKSGGKYSDCSLANEIILRNTGKEPTASERLVAGAVQSELNSIFNTQLDVDGWYGSQSAGTVADLQKELSLPATGVLVVQTFYQLQLAVESGVWCELSDEPVPAGFGDFRVAQETGNGGLSEQELRNQLGALIKEHLNFVEENKNIGFYSTNESIDIVLKYDKTISDVSEQLGVPKAMIQAVLFKEIRMKDALDVLADSFVIEYYRYNHSVEDYDNLSFWQKVFVRPPQPASLMREDSSTGLGQIFAETAIDAYNAGISRGDISGSNIDYNDWHQREKVWNELRDDKTNIFYAGLVLKQKAEILKIDLNNVTDNEIEKTLARYNGFGYAAAEYGRETKQYYDLFSQFNK